MCMAVVFAAAAVREFGAGVFATAPPEIPLKTERANGCGRMSAGA